MDIIIRKYVNSDIRPFYEAVLESKNELMTWFPWCHEGYTLEEAAYWIEHQAPSIWSNQQGCEYIITDPENRMLGSCCLEQLDLQKKTASLGYWVRTNETRKGIATKACLFLLNYGFNALDLKSIDVIVSLNNLASQSVAKKLPYDSFWKIENGFQVRKEVSDALVYRISKPSFIQSKSF